MYDQLHLRLHEARQQELEQDAQRARLIKEAQAPNVVDQFVSRLNQVRKNRASHKSDEL